METGLPSFDTVIHNCYFVFNRSWHSCPNELVKHFCIMNKFVCDFRVIFVCLCVSVCFPLFLSVCLSVVLICGPCCLK